MHELNFTGRKGNQTPTSHSVAEGSGYEAVTEREMLSPQPPPDNLLKVITGTAICDTSNLTVRFLTGLSSQEGFWQLYVLFLDPA